MQRRWREAITYREKTPHEYIVRLWETHEQGNRARTDVPEPWRKDGSLNPRERPRFAGDPGA